MGIATIVEMGGEGGTIALEGCNTDGTWRYRVRTSDHALVMLGEASAPVSTETAWVDTWRKAMSQLDKYQWHRLSLITVHPEFGNRVHICLNRRRRAAEEI
jgi:hypothetical protein